MRRGHVEIDVVILIVCAILVGGWCFQVARAVTEYRAIMAECSATTVMPAVELPELVLPAPAVELPPPPPPPLDIQIALPPDPAAARHGADPAHMLVLSGGVLLEALANATPANGPVNCFMKQFMKQAGVQMQVGIWTEMGWISRDPATAAWQGFMIGL